MNLFRTGEFTLNSGIKSKWKIECDALTKEDWDGLAAMASELLPPFGVVEGVPRGGLPFADALRKYATPGCSTILVADDVWTTGGSMRRFIEADFVFPPLVIGVVAFARGPVPSWVTALFKMPGA